MTRILHLITGPDGMGLQLSDAAGLVALCDMPGVQLAWMIPPVEQAGHEDLRLRGGAVSGELRRAAMAELLLRDYGGRQAPALLMPSLHPASLSENTDPLLLPWAEVLQSLHTAFRQAGTDMQLRLWHAVAPGAQNRAPAQAALADLGAALRGLGFEAQECGLLQPEPDTELGRGLVMAALVNLLTARVADLASAAGLRLVSGRYLRAHVGLQLEQLVQAGLAPDAENAPVLDALAQCWMRRLLDPSALIESR